MRQEQQKQFDELIDSLKTDSFFGIRVFNLSTGLPIIKDLDGEAIAAQYGSVDDFFNSVFTSGVTSIMVRTRRKNGTMRNGTVQNWKDGKEPLLTFNLSQNQEPAQPVANHAEVQPKNNAPLHAPGLNVPIPIDHYTQMRIDSDEKIRLTERNKYLEQRILDLEKENKRYEIREIKEDAELSRMKQKSDSFNKNLETAAPLLSPLMETLSKLAGNHFGGAQASGAALAQPSNLSEQKQALIDVIVESDEFTAKLLAYIHDSMGMNVDFANELNELLKKYNIIVQ